MPLLKLDRDGNLVPVTHKPKVKDTRPRRSPELGRNRWTQLSRRVLARARRNGEPCHICGGPEVRGDARLGFTVDHLVPRARGGGDLEANLAPAHRACNSAKGQK